MRSQLPRSPRAQAAQTGVDAAGDAAEHRLDDHAAGGQPVGGAASARSATTSWPGTNGNDTIGSK